MAEFDNENQDGGVSEETTTEERSFGEVAERDETDDIDSTGDTGDGETGDESGETGNEGEGDQSGEEGKPELTEKGTKLDPNPKSRVHQELANERRARSQMEQVLANPDLLTKFMKQQYGIDIPTTAKAGESNQPAPEVKQFTPADFETLDDVAKVMNEVQSGFQAKVREQGEIIEQLGMAVHSLMQGGNAQRLFQTMTDEATALQREPELDPKNPEFIDGLEQEIANMYHKLDFDERTQTYRGQYSLADIGKSMIATARKARKNGSQRAQTVVKNKSEGAVRTGTKVKESAGEEDSNPASSIAAGVAKLFG